MKYSLDKLASLLSDDELIITKLDTLPEDIPLLRKKGVYPYEYMDGYDVFRETELPPKGDFFSRLTNAHITDQEYEHAKNIWSGFECSNMGDYHDLYLQTDVRILADVFQSFRANSMKNYGLDPCNYVSVPSLAWDALLKTSKVELDLLTDMSMYDMIESSKRGGISMVSKRYSEANNPMCSDRYDSSKPNKWLMYLDANNLYGWAMSQSLPISDFKWVTIDNTTLDTILSCPEDSEVGYIVEVDMDYPSELHRLHNDYPLAPEPLTVTEKSLSPYQKQLLEHLGHQYYPCRKLIPNLMNKRNYVTHYRNLQYYVKQGLVITNLSRVVSFRQSAWMSGYISLNTELRKKAKTDLEKEFYKLMNNSVYGKTMENVRNRMKIDLITDDVNPERLRRLIADVNYKGFHDFGCGVAAIHRHQKRLILNKPIAVGTCVLDLSKLLMYNFWYGEIKSKYGKRAQLCYTDTDSLLFEVVTPDVYADMAASSHLYDLGDYPKDHPLHSDENKKVLGKMKDEMNGVPLLEFIGLRPKMYSLLDLHMHEKKRAKGVPSSIVRDTAFNHELYRESLFKEIETEHSSYAIRSKNHQLGLYAITKKTLCPFDSKKYICKDKVRMFSYGYNPVKKHSI